MPRISQLLTVILIVSSIFACGDLTPLAPQHPTIEHSEFVEWKLHSFDGKSWVNCMAPGDEGEIWASLYGKGLAHFNGEKWVHFSKSNTVLPTDSILSLVTDQESNLWAGTTRGLVKYDGVKWTLYNNENTPLPSNSARALAIDKNNVLWVGCSGQSNGGIAAFDGVSWRIYTNENSGFKSTGPVKIIVDENNTKWVGLRSSSVGSGGLARFTSDTWDIYTPENSNLLLQEVQDMALDNEGNIWLGVQEYYAFGTHIQSALVKFDGSKWQNVRMVSNQFFSAIGFSSDQNYLWAAQSSNPALSPITYNISIFDAPQWVGLTTLDPKFPQLYIFDIQADKNNRIWLSSTVGIIEVAPISLP